MAPCRLSFPPRPSRAPSTCADRHGGRQRRGQAGQAGPATPTRLPAASRASTGRTRFTGTSRPGRRRRPPGERRRGARVDRGRIQPGDCRVAVASQGPGQGQSSAATSAWSSSSSAERPLTRHRTRRRNRPPSSARSARLTPRRGITLVHHPSGLDPTVATLDLRAARRLQPKHRPAVPNPANSRLTARRPDTPPRTPARVNEEAPPTTQPAAPHPAHLTAEGYISGQPNRTSRPLPEEATARVRCLPNSRAVSVFARCRPRRGQPPDPPTRGDAPRLLRSSGRPIRARSESSLRTRNVRD